MNKIVYLFTTASTQRIPPRWRQIQHGKFACPSIWRSTSTAAAATTTAWRVSQLRAGVSAAATGEFVCVCICESIVC